MLKTPLLKIRRPEIPGLPLARSNRPGGYGSKDGTPPSRYSCASVQDDDGLLAVVRAVVAAAAQEEALDRALVVAAQHGGRMAQRQAVKPCAGTDACYRGPSKRWPLHVGMMPTGWVHAGGACLLDAQTC